MLQFLFAHDHGLEAQIAALPYDVYNREEACTVVKGKPLSFLNIDRAETQFDASVGTYDDVVYQKAHDLLWEMIGRGDFVQEEKPVYYLYELTMNGRVQTGIVACASVEDYQNQIILPYVSPPRFSIFLDFTAFHFNRLY